MMGRFFAHYHEFTPFRREYFLFLGGEMKIGADVAGCFAVPLSDLCDLSSLLRCARNDGAFNEHLLADVTIAYNRY